MAQDVVGGCADAQAVGLQHGGIEFVVQFFEYTDQTCCVDGLLFGRQGPLFSERFEDVVQAGEGQFVFALAGSGASACWQRGSR